MLPAVKARQPHPGPADDRTGRGAPGPWRPAFVVIDRRTVAACPRKTPFAVESVPLIEISQVYRIR